MQFSCPSPCYRLRWLLGVPWQLEACLCPLYVRSGCTVEKLKLSYPNVCPEEVKGAIAFCAKHCLVAEKRGIPTKLQDFLKFCGLEGELHVKSVMDACILAMVSVMYTLIIITLQKMWQPQRTLLCTYHPPMTRWWLWHCWRVQWMLMRVSHLLHVRKVLYKNYDCFPKHAISFSWHKVHDLSHLMFRYMMYINYMYM